MRNKKKIIRAVTVPNSIDFFEEIIVRMKEDGYETVVVTSPGKLLDEFKERHEDVRAVAVPMERHISLKSDIVSLFKMIKVFAKERPYVVHSMTPKAGLVSMIAAKITGVPVRIHTFTGLVWPTATGIKRKILMATDKILCACATHIIPEGQGVLNDLKNNGVCKKPMKVLGYGNVMGVDMERFNPLRIKSKVSVEGLEVSGESAESESLSSMLSTISSQKAKPFTFLFVGRIVGDKGINELVKAFTKLHDKYPQTRLVLVGRYETELDPVSELTQERIEANKSIVLAGEKFGDELLKEYVKADCFVMPSYREGFPNTVLEAGAMGLPQIVTDINGSREIITNLNHNANPNIVGKMDIRDNGIVIPSKDVDALYCAMERMIESWEESRNLETSELRDSNMYLRMKENARPMIESRFEQGFVRKCLFDFYDEIFKR